MKLGLLACGLIASLSSVVSATALTYKLLANEKACFFTSVEQKGAKVAFYFAVSVFNGADIHKANRRKLFRCNRVALLMSIMKLLDLTKKSSWMVKRSDKVTLFSPQMRSENIDSVSTMR